LTSKLNTSATAKARVKTKALEESAEGLVAIKPAGKDVSFMSLKFRSSPTIQAMTVLPAPESSPPTSVPTLKKSDHNLVWLDCEMTGLDPERERIIEVAIVITGPNLEPRIEGPVLVIHQSDALLAAMDKWNQGAHSRSGLIDKVKLSSITEAQAQEQLLAFARQYVPAGKAPLCGNSISQDRRFLMKFMPQLDAFFHYRNIDVSTIKELCKRWRPDVYKGFKKKQRHTALADVHESIDELAHYQKHFFADSIG
jgi:oligoribonuclease